MKQNFIDKVFTSFEHMRRPRLGENVITAGPVIILNKNLITLKIVFLLLPFGKCVHVFS